MTTVEKILPVKRQFNELAAFLMPRLGEGALARPNIERALAKGYAIVTEDMTFAARNDKGEIVGSIALTEDQFWYSDDTFLQNPWFYVRPDCRFGDVGVKLLRAAAKVADERDLLCFIIVTTPDRRPKGTALSLYAQIAGHVPLGHVLALRRRAGGVEIGAGIRNGD